MATKSVLFLAAWCGCVATGLAVMFHYELAPALVMPARDEWPTSSRLRRDAVRPTLLMFVHPRCPCSRASLAELDRLATSCGDRVAVQIIFVRPAETADGWERTSLWRTAEGIPGAAVFSDPGGKEAAQLNAATSGETLLYSPSGRLLFQGGLTVSRGHEGASPGFAALSALIDTGKSQRAASAVYGCGLASRSR